MKRETSPIVRAYAHRKFSAFAMSRSAISAVADLLLQVVRTSKGSQFSIDKKLFLSTVWTL